MRRHDIEKKVAGYEFVGLKVAVKGSRTDFLQDLIQAPLRCKFKRISKPLMLIDPKRWLP